MRYDKDNKPKTDDECLKLLSYILMKYFKDKKKGVKK